MEYGIFSDEGCIEADFFTKEEAEAAIVARYSADDGLYVAEMSRDQDGCEAGYEDEDEDEDEDE